MSQKKKVIDLSGPKPKKRSVSSNSLTPDKYDNNKEEEEEFVLDDELEYVDAYKADEIRLVKKKSKPDFTHLPSPPPPPNDGIDVYGNAEVVVFADGSCLNNGKNNASAGIGIHFVKPFRRSYSIPYNGGTPSYTNISTPIPVPSVSSVVNEDKSVGESDKAIFNDTHGLVNIVNNNDSFTPTNIRAELSAIFITYILIENCVPGYEQGAQGTKVLLYTDSETSMNSLTKWCNAWLVNGFKNANGGDIKNQDILKPLLQLKRNNPNVQLNFVKAHSGNKDIISVTNKLVDKLAKQAASISKSSSSLSLSPSSSAISN